MEFLTAEEKVELEARLKGLYTKQKELVVRIAEARAKGDLKENADYHAAREDHGMNARVIGEVEEKLKNAAVTDPSVVPEGMVFLGATVKLRNTKTGSEDLYKLVGEAKADLDADFVEVSSNSPMGQSLMKAHVGEKIRVDLPRGNKEFEIVEIV